MQQNLTIYSHHQSFVHHYSFVYLNITSLSGVLWFQIYFYLMEYNAGHYITNKNEVKEFCVSQEKNKDG